MDQANDSSKTDLSRTIMSSMRSAVTALPSPERMTIAMLLQPQSSHNHHRDEDDSSDEARRRRLCSYLQQALDLADVTDIDLHNNTIEDEQEWSLKR
jgi:hypothetical protein